jgi:hypothetical protein
MLRLKNFKKALLIAAIATIVALGTAVTVYGPALVGATLTLQPWTVASLPTASANTNRIFEIHDGLNADDCTIGGGSTTVHCESNGTAYYSLSAGRNLRISPQDYGVDITGATDSTTQMQATIVADCPGYGTAGAVCGTIELPNFSKIEISQLQIYGTSGFRMTGEQAQGEGTGWNHGNALFVVVGNSSPVIDLQQSRDSELDHFAIMDYTGGGRTLINYDQPYQPYGGDPTVSNLSTNNRMENLTLTSYGEWNSTFIGVDLCPLANGNCEDFYAKNIVISCGQGEYGPSHILTGGTVYYTISGSVTGTPHVGETFTQAVSGAAAVYYSPSPAVNGIVVAPPTGTPNTSGTWTGGVSGATVSGITKVPHVSDSGVGILIGSITGGGGGEPFNDHLEGINTQNCSTGIQVNAADTLYVEGGLSTDYTDLLVNEGTGIVYENFRSEYAAQPIIIIGGDIDIKNYVSGAEQNNTTTIQINGANHVRVIDSDWEGYTTSNSIMPIKAVFGNGASIISENNSYVGTGNCPNWGNFSFASSEGDAGCQPGRVQSTFNTPRFWSLSGSDNYSTNVGEPSMFLAFGAGNSGGTDYSLMGVVNHNASPGIGTTSYFSISHPAYPSSSSLTFTLPPVSGGLNTSVLPTPALASVVKSGTAGSTHYTYTVTTWDSQGHTAASTGVTVTNGNATLSGSNCNVINFNDTGTGAWFYTIRRTASGGTPSTTGIIDYVWPYQNTGTGYTIYDCGLAGDSTSAETTNTTGYLNAAMGITYAPQLFSKYPTCAAGTEGMTEAVTDSTTNTWGGTVTGGAGYHIKMYCDGTNWTVTSK